MHHVGNAFRDGVLHCVALLTTITTTSTGVIGSSKSKLKSDDVGPSKE